MKTILAIGLGSMIGGVLRYLISGVFNKDLKSFPAGTLLVNLSGCLLIGIFFALIEKGRLTNDWYPFLITGILGGFTTFSAFSLETIHLMRHGLIYQAGIYVAVSIFAGLAATAAGYYLFKLI